MRVGVLLACCTFHLLNALPAACQQQPTLVSVNSNGTGSGNSRSGDFDKYRVSADGRYVVFYSEASNIVSLDTSSNGDIFVRDLQTGTTKLASINSAGTASGNGISSFGLISADGRYVAFTSHASNIVANDTNTSADVFVRDLQTGTTSLVSINAAGTASGRNGSSELLDISPDGRFMTFTSHASDLTPHAVGNVSANNIYVRDTVAKTTALVTVNAAGTASGNGTSYGGSVSGNGRYVVFTSESNDLVPNDDGSRSDVFLRDVQAGTTTRLSTNSAGTAGGNGESGGGVIDRGGHFVVFLTKATNLSTLPDTNNISDIFIYDVLSGGRRLVTVNASGTDAGRGLDFGDFEHGIQFSISDDARFVAFQSQSGDLVTNDTNGSGDDIFRYEVATQAKSLVSVNLAGTSGTSGGSFRPSLSADGRFVAFESLANDLVSVADETNGSTTDVFVRDVVAGQTFLASVNSAGSRTGNGFSFQPFISADGTRLVFHSRASNLVTNDFNGFAEDVFAFTIVNDGAPVLLTEENTERAVALDSVTQTRDPFPLINTHNFSSDQRTRVSLFTKGLELLPGEDASALSALAEDGQGNVYILSVEYFGALTGVTSIKQLIIKLPENISTPNDLWVKITLRSTTTNRALIKIKAP
jgi:hypothetical protein